ncbi:MAG: TerB N-terminal domain-containing protein [Chloroflexi bacterium]|nr:TerB N-terminal domain-containing protein [Chloroflexota bacterium]
MFSQLIRQTVQFLTGGPYRLSLQRSANQIILGSHKGRRPVPLHRISRKFPPIAELEKLLAPPIDQDTFVVPLTNLSAVKALLATFTTLDLLIEIAPDAAALEPSPIPEQFEVRYFWDVDEECLRQQTWPDTVYFGKGWFANQNSYWFIGDTTDEDSHWLDHRKITGSDIIHFLTRIVPAWKERKLPFYCHLNYNVAAAVTFNIISATDNTVELQTTWHVETRFIRPINTLGNHILIFDEIRPGIAPQVLPFEARFANGNVTLQDEVIPHFVDNVWPLIQPFTQGAKEAFLKRHPVIRGQTSLEFVVQSQKERGIGKPVIVPMFTCGTFSLPGQEAAALLVKQQTYYRVTNGWLPAVLMQDVGLRASNRTQSGLDLSPIPLTPIELIRRQTKRATAPVVFPPITLPQAAKATDAAAQHVQFLREWGLPGGLIGTASHYTTALKMLAVSLMNDYLPARILVLGSADALNSLTVSSAWKQLVTARFDGGKQDGSFHASLRGVIFATPKALDRHPALLQTEWELLLLLGADDLIKSNRSALYRQLTACHKLLAIGLFHDDQFLQKPIAKEAMTEVLGLPVNEADSLWRYVLRDPQQEPPPLPTSLSYAETRPATTPRSPSPFAEYQVIGDTDRGRAIPPRPAPPPAHPTRPEPVISVHTLSREQRFVQEARKWANHSERQSMFVPFQQYWPTYDALIIEQRRWYFYWRSEVRQQRFPKTDISYIFLHAYELIHQIGAPTNNDGYQQLTRLWLNYRRTFPQLDNYLPDWIADYAVVHRCSVSPLKIYNILATEPGSALAARHTDLILAHYVDKPFNDIPLALLDLLTSHQLQKSPFYLEGHQELVAQYVPDALENINHHFIQRDGQGIFARYRPQQTVTVKRAPFSSAIYNGPKQEQVIATVIPYSQHIPLRQFLTRAVKYSENRLRELKKFEGRLRDDVPDPETEAILDAFFKRVARTITPQPVINLDHSEIGRLRRESDELFALLAVPEAHPVDTSQVEGREKGNLGGDGEGEFAAAPAPSRPEIPPHQPATPLVAPLLPSDRPRLQLDTSLLARTQRDTEAVFRLIHAAEDPDEAEPDARNNEAAFDRPPPSEAEPDQFDWGTRPRPSANDLPEEWQAFASQISDYHYRILMALLTEPNPLTTIRAIADERITMPEPLFDEINEIAQETLGDILILTDGASPTVLEDYTTELQSLLQHTGES